MAHLSVTRTRLGTGEKGQAAKSLNDEKLMQNETDSKPFLDRRLGRRKVHLKCKFSFVFQCSFADKFSITCPFFRHEQRVSLRLPLSVLSEIIISWNEQFSAKKVTSRRNI